MKPSDAFFVDRPKVGDHTVQPFTAGHFFFLQRRKNALFSDQSEQDETAAAIELFFVATRKRKDLLRLKRASKDEWDAAVEDFALGIEPGDLEAFGRLSEDELGALKDSQATPTGKEAANQAG